MKTERSLQKSAKSRLNGIVIESAAIYALAKSLKDDGFNGDVMRELRESTETLVQCVHEFNAYHNALSTD